MGDGKAFPWPTVIRLTVAVVVGVLGCERDDGVPSGHGIGAADGSAATGGAPAAGGGASGGARAGGSGTGSGGAAGSPAANGGASGSDARPGPDVSEPSPPGVGAGTCQVVRPGASGREPNASIPVCCLPSASDKTLIDEVFRLLNSHRMANGRAPLTYDPALEQAIQGHCRHMAEHPFFDHAAPEAEVQSFTTRARLCGANASGENIAYNQANPDAVMKSWMGSAGHNQNMLSANYRRVGICHHQRRWGQIFGR